MQIVSDISSRVSLVRSKRRQLPTGTDIPLKYQQQLKSEYYESGSKPQFLSLSSSGDFTSTKSQRATRALKLTNLLGNTERQRIEISINKILFDNTPEAKTVNEFINNIHVLQRNPETMCVTLRNFIDGMKVYIMEERSNELMKLMVEANEESNNTLDDLSLTSSVETCLERVVIEPLFKKLMTTLNGKNKQEDAELNIRLKLLKTRNQSFFGVMSEDQSNQSSAIDVLSTLCTIYIPTEMLKCILETAKSIYNNVSNEKGKVEFLSADQFLPIIIYVIVQCEIYNLQSYVDFISNLAGI